MDPPVRSVYCINLTSFHTSRGSPGGFRDPVGSGHSCISNASRCGLCQQIASHERRQAGMNGARTLERDTCAKGSSCEQQRGLLDQTPCRGRLVTLETFIIDSFTKLGDDGTERDFGGLQVSWQLLSRIESISPSTSALSAYTQMGGGGTYGMPATRPCLAFPGFKNLIHSHHGRSHLSASFAAGHDCRLHP